jgi:hypothetical protein
MVLVPWNHEPDAYHLLALYAGSERRFERFVQFWFDHRGDLDVLAARLPAEFLRAAGCGPAVTAAGYAVSFGLLPEYHLLGWLLRQPQWRVYYSPRPPHAAERIRGEVQPEGAYFPWSRRPQSLPAWPDRPVLHRDDGQPLDLVQASGRFVNLFKLLGAAQPQMLGPDGPARPQRAQPEPEPSRSYTIPLRLVECGEGERPVNPSQTIQRLQEEINNLNEQLELLRWWMVAPQVSVRLYAYPETGEQTPGSAWDLRDWFSRASDRALREFEHTRVIVSPPEGAPAGEQLPPLHLVVPVDLTREPRANLPPPAYRLDLDYRWHQKGRRLFTPAGWELTPPPPWDNPHVEKLMADCLWGPENQHETLVVLRTREGAEYRFNAGGWRPLREQIRTLNIQVVTQRAAGEWREVQLRELDEAAEQIRVNVEDAFAACRQQMRACLDEIWSGPRADVDHHRLQVNEALQIVREIGALQTRIAAFRKEEHQLWSQFRQEVLELDLDLIPRRASRLRGELGELDRLRGQVAELCMEDRRQDPRQVAAALRRLADRLQTLP